MKNPPCQSAWRVSEYLFCELYQLFSSFLRGASRPKSPRDAVLTASSFMLELEMLVKLKFNVKKGLTTVFTLYASKK